MYILKCSNGSYYVGSTTNIELRIQQHQMGEGANYTKKHLPVELVYYEIYSRIDEAFAREKQVQGWRREKKKHLLITNPMIYICWRFVIITLRIKTLRSLSEAEVKVKLKRKYDKKMCTSASLSDHFFRCFGSFRLRSMTESPIDISVLRLRSATERSKQLYGR